MIYNINEFLTEGDIMQINNTIKQYEIFQNFDINKNIINCSYLQSRNLLLIYNYFKDNLINYVLTIINLITKDIILYLKYFNKLKRFINYKSKISLYYGNSICALYMNMNKEIIKYKNMVCKSIIIKKNNIKFRKTYKNNKIYTYLLYNMYNHFFCIYNIYYNKYNYKIYKILSYKTLNNKKYNIYKKFNIYKNILI